MSGKIRWHGLTSELLTVQAEAIPAEALAKFAGPGQVIIMKPGTHAWIEQKAPPIPRPEQVW